MVLALVSESCGERNVKLEVKIVSAEREAVVIGLRNRTHIACSHRTSTSFGAR